jgi:hypothetical protein
MNYIFFSVSRPGEPMSPNTTHQNQNFDDVQELPEIGENLTGKISEPLKESETALHKGDQDNCDANTFLETVQVHSENAASEGNYFSQNT